MSSENLYCIHAGYEHFITYSQYQRQANANNIKQELLIHFGHINTHLLFIYFVDVVNRNRVSGGNQIKWNYLNKSKPVNYANLQVFILNFVFTF